jgi:dipeptidyl aminopeptidase/acylaminoacyl peptidase
MKSSIAFAVLGAVLALGAATPALAQDLPAAITQDPPVDPAHKASMEVVHIPTHGVEINGVLYRAAGPGLHPTVVLYHGLPGNEQNLDLAQAMRRDGWNVLTLHYRGAWGSPGQYSFHHVFEDAQAALDFVRDPAVAAKYGIDVRRIVVMGHSMGGMAASIVGDHNADLAGVGMISAANFAFIGAGQSPASLTKFMAGNHESLNETPEQMAAEAIAGARDWDFVKFAPNLAKHPLLLITSDDGLRGASDALAKADRALGGAAVTEVHLATDHSYSDHRIALETAVIRWLDGLPAGR